MSTGIETLPRILKDETRRRTLTLLSEQGSLSYTELMDALNIVSTGTLNYHLKVLGDLLTKNDAGRYVLSEKGELALRLLKLFPAENDVLLKKKRQKQFWTIAAVSQVIYFVSALALYYLNYIDFGRLVEYTMWFFGGVALAYLGYRMQDRQPMSGSDEEKKRLKIAYTMLGGVAGLAIAFFGTPILSVYSVSVGGPNLLRLIDSYIFEYVTLLAIASILGGFAGYGIGKRNKFNKPKWMRQTDEKFGF